jgi:hypothetical protein
MLLYRIETRAHETHRCPDKKIGEKMLLSTKSWKFITAAALCAQSFNLMAADPPKPAAPAATPAAKPAEPAKTPEAPKAAAEPAKPADAAKAPALPAGTSASSSTINTESVISGISATDRTRPFPVGEKLAYFVNIKDGDKVKSPFRVAFVISGMGVSPVKAGPIENTGHHHILIDMPFPADIKKPIPFDAPDEYKNQHYKHYGKGETETVLNLPPGKHTLRLLFADHQHVPHYISSKPITIEVIDAPK